MTHRRFRFGVNCTTTSATEWLDAARRAEDLGYSTLIAQDHFANQLAPLPALMAAAGVTTTLRLAALVLDNDFRHPALVAKEAATIDLLSNGRMELGLGAGWLEADYTRTGLRLDPPGVRVERLAEAVQIIKRLLQSPEPLSFDGVHYQLANLDATPRPVQQPRPPLMLGGRQRRMLSLAAREADIVSISLLDPGGPDYATRVGWVREAAGPRFDELELHVNASLVAVDTAPSQQELERIATRTGQAPDQVIHSPGSLVGSVQQIIETLHARREEFGLSYYVVQLRNMHALSPVLAAL